MTKFLQRQSKRYTRTMTNLFNKAAWFTDIHYGMRNNAKWHNEDCDAFIDWFIE